MIYWITGRRNSGKTTLAYKMKELLEERGESVVILDGDEIRSEFPIGYGDPERWKRTYVIAKLAVIFERQGMTVIIALLSEKRNWRIKARKLFKESRLIYLPGGKEMNDSVYESPSDRTYEVPTKEELYG